ncbi:MAG: hypothetical protein MJY89_02660 [Bacteroidales bacterium]|nr:hypothetical protein [Bacteroidales bacterium]
MMGVRQAAAVAAVAFLSLLTYGCVRPETTEQFVRSKDSVGGVYSFDVAFEDTAGTYDLSFFTRIDTPLRAEEPACMRLDVLWRAPSGKSSGETVYMDVAEQREKYRSGVVPKEFGKWRIDVKIPDPPEGLRGLGMIIEHNGTR